MPRFGFIQSGFESENCGYPQATREVAMPKRRLRRVNHRHIKRDPKMPFSQGVLVGNTLYLSGHIGLAPDTKRVPTDTPTEVHYLMKDVRSVLKEAGMTMDDLVYVQVFCPDVSLWECFNEIYSTYFKGDLPARAFVGSGKLLFDAHFELQAIAVKR
jgi:2-iminobutanoate/2-iminopropanoate deaminase